MTNAIAPLNSYEVTPQLSVQVPVLEDVTLLEYVNGGMNINLDLLYNITTTITDMQFNMNFFCYATTSADSIVYPNLAHKYINRMVWLELKLLIESAQKFDHSNLGNIIRFIDVFSKRDHLYERRLTTDCSFIFQDEIKLNEHWDVVLMPLKRYVINRHHFTTNSLKQAMELYFLLLVWTKMKSQCVHFPIIVNEYRNCMTNDDVDEIVRKYYLDYIRNLNTKEIAHV